MYSPTNVEEVVTYVKNNSNITVVSGGHSYITPTGTNILSLANFNDITIDLPNNRVTVGSGVLLGDLYTALINEKHICVAGTCPTVAIGGLVLGGGLSVLMRLYGIASDNVLSAQVVMATGEIKTVNGGDLLWLLKGAGQGVFVLISLTLKIYALPDITYDYELTLKNWDDAYLAIDQLQSMGVPNHVFYQLHLNNYSLKLLIHAHGRQWLPYNCNLFNVTTYVRTNYTDSVDFWSIGNIGLFTNRISSMQYCCLDCYGVEKLAHIGEAESYCTLILDLMGGKVRSSCSAFPHADALYSYQYLVDAATEDELSVGSIWMTKNYLLMQEYMDGAYVNYCNIYQPSEFYFLQNYDRVKKLWDRYDPNKKFVQLFN